MENPQVEISLFETEISATDRPSVLKKLTKKAKPAVGARAQSEPEQGQGLEGPQEERMSPAKPVTSSPVFGADQVTHLPKVLVQERAEYPESAKQARVEGVVKLAVIVDSLGLVQSAEVLEGPGFGLNETAQMALMKFRFSPAEKDGSKVPVKIIYVYRFRLESR